MISSKILIQEPEPEDSISKCYADKLNRILDTSNKDKSILLCDHFTNDNHSPDPTITISNHHPYPDRNGLPQDPNLLSSMTLEEQLQPHSASVYSSNCWSSFRLPFTPFAVSMTVSDSAVWLVEGGKGQIYWCKISSSTISWKYISGLTAKQLTTSYNGKIVLALTKDNILYRRKGVGHDHPSGTSWENVCDGKLVIAQI